MEINHWLYAIAVAIVLVPILVLILFHCAENGEIKTPDLSIDFTFDDATRAAILTSAGVVPICIVFVLLLNNVAMMQIAFGFLAFITLLYASAMAYKNIKKIKADLAQKKKDKEFGSSLNANGSSVAVPFKI